MDSALRSGECASSKGAKNNWAKGCLSRRCLRWCAQADAKSQYKRYTHILLFQAVYTYSTLSLLRYDSPARNARACVRACKSRACMRASGFFYVLRGSWCSVGTVIKVELFELCTAFFLWKNALCYSSHHMILNVHDPQCLKREGGRGIRGRDSKRGER